MPTLNLSEFLTALGRTSLQAGILVLAVLLVQWLLRKQLSPRWRCALWLLVAARLLLPVSLSSAASLFNLLPRPTAAVRAVEMAAATASPATMPPPRQDRVRPPAPPAVIPEAVIPVAPETAASAVQPPIPDTPSTHSQPPTRASAPSAPVPWPLILFGLWGTGVALLAAQLIVSSLRMVRRFGRLPICEDPTVLAVLEECRARLQVKTPLPVAECASVSSPALYGLLRPRLLLPPGFAAMFSAAEMEFVFLHELAHLKRRDLWLNWLFTALQVLHWFNPLVWLAFARWRADRELACDALALDAAGTGRNRAYGQTILRLLADYSHQPAAPALVGILEDKRQLQQRLRMIANFRPGRRWGVLSVGLLGVLAVVGLTDAQTARPKSEGPSALSSTATTNVAVAAREVRVGADPVPELTGTNVEVRALTVTVLDATTGQPIAGAEVLARYIGGQNLTQVQRRTDDQGKFILRYAMPPKEAGVRRSSVSLSVRSDRHAQRSVSWSSSDLNVDASLPAEVTLKLLPGVPIGGVVQDERGQPLPGVRVLLSGSNPRGTTSLQFGPDGNLIPPNGNAVTAEEHAEVSGYDKRRPAAVTDVQGRWTFTQAPGDLAQWQVTFVRPDDAQESFTTFSDAYRPWLPLISLNDLKRQQAVTKLRDGVTVRGICVDEAGRPLSGVAVQEGYGLMNIVRTSEFTTGADGRFERPHRAPRQWIYTASRADRATVSVVAQVEPGMGEVRLVLPPAKPVRVRVTDEAGQPVPDAEFTLNTFRTEGQILAWSARTDADGVVVWTNAPTAPLTLNVNSKSLGSHRKVRVSVGETDKRVVMSPTATDQIAVHVKAKDAMTGLPVKVRRVSAELASASPVFTELAAPFSGDFSLPIQRSFFTADMYPSFRLKFEADGYVNLVTESVDFDAGNQELDLALTPIHGAREVIVLQPDGKPAVGAQLWAHATPDGGSLFINGSDSYHAARLTKTETGSDGQVKLPGVPDDSPVVITHASGILETPMGTLRRSNEVRLQPYGVVAGQFLVAGQPKGGATVSLTSCNWSTTAGFLLSYRVETGREGQFMFTRVPPGEYRLYRQITQPGRGIRAGRITESYQVPITVQAGETNQVDYVSHGRVVFGQAATDPADLPVDWQNDDHVLSLKLPAAATRIRPNQNDFATLAAYQKASAAFNRSVAGSESAQAARTYQLVFQKDGSFRAEDVPPGTYELTIRVTKPGGRQREPFPRAVDELGSLVHEVVVPEGKEPFDLGTMRIPMKGEVGAR
jgi:beta-lactamase regulating signal transducer with metallopeptidase domain